MTLKEFQILLTVKHPQAKASRSKEVGGINRQDGLTISLVPDGKLYSYTGTYQEIAYQLGLIEKWYILENDGVVGQAISEKEAHEKLEVLKANAIKTANSWGYSVGKFTVKRV